MKTRFIRALVKATLCISGFIFIPPFSYSQPDYDFRNAVLISGTALQKGATYRFPDVKSGYDAIVTIADITGGLTIVDLDAGSGYAEALQPTTIYPLIQTAMLNFLWSLLLPVPLHRQCKQKFRLPALILTEIKTTMEMETRYMSLMRF